MEQEVRIKSQNSINGRLEEENETKGMLVDWRSGSGSEISIYGSTVLKISTRILIKLITVSL